MLANGVRGSRCGRSRSSAMSPSTSEWCWRWATSSRSPRCIRSTRSPRSSRPATMRPASSTRSSARWPVRSRRWCRCRWASRRARGSRSAPRRSARGLRGPRAGGFAGCRSAHLRATSSDRSHHRRGHPLCFALANRRGVGLNRGRARAAPGCVSAHACFSLTRGNTISIRPSLLSGFRSESLREPLTSARCPPPAWA